MSKRLIDANALIADIAKRYCEPCKAEGKDYHEVACRACWVDDMRIEIEDAPTVDAVEVVRCKDCKWYQIRQFDNGTPKYDCRKTHALLDVKQDDFCSYGERKDNDFISCNNT